MATYSINDPITAGFPAVVSLTMQENELVSRHWQTVSSGVGGSSVDAWKVAFSDVGQVPCVTSTES